MKFTLRGISQLVFHMFYDIFIPVIIIIIIPFVNSIIFLLQYLNTGIFSSKWQDIQ